MKKIVLAVATVLFASGMAFAGSDYYGSDHNHGFDQSNTGHHAMVSDSAHGVDPIGTESISTADSAPALGGNPYSGIPTISGQGVWGH
ncbi:hypothetical protein [Mesorhizobium shangrilense]|uniref:DUF680 domain-containing protein n=1 Tax=Mesorhizobium shangrilense TaxID=460060 RepID=A0ABV2D896_9HYPH